MFTTRHYKKPKPKLGAGTTRGLSVLAQKFADAAAPTKIDEEFMAGLATANQQNIADDPSSVPDAGALENLLSVDDAAGEARFEDQLLALLAAGTITPAQATQRRNARLKEATERFDSALEAAVKGKHITKTEAIAIKRERRAALAQLAAHQRTAEAVRGTKTAVERSSQDQIAAVQQARDAQIAATDNATAAVRGSIKEGKTNAREIVRAVRDSINETVQSRGEAAAHHQEAMLQAHRLHDDVRDMKSSTEETVDELKGLRTDHDGHTDTLGKHLAKIRNKLSDVQKTLEENADAAPPAERGSKTRSRADRGSPPASFLSRVTSIFSPSEAASQPSGDDEDPEDDEEAAAAAAADDFRTEKIRDFTGLWPAEVNKKTKMPGIVGNNSQKALARAVALAAGEKHISFAGDEISILTPSGDVRVPGDVFRAALDHIRKQKVPTDDVTSSAASALMALFSTKEYRDRGFSEELRWPPRIPAAVAEEDEAAPATPVKRRGRRAQSEPAAGARGGNGLPVVGGGLPVVGGELPIVGGGVSEKRKKRSAPPTSRPSPEKRREIADILLKTAQEDLMAARDLLIQTRARGVWPHNEYSALATEIVEEQKRQHYGRGLSGKPKNLGLRLSLEELRKREPHLLL